MNTTWPWKKCGECGTSLETNRFGDIDCPHCNIENFLYPFSRKKEPKEEEKEIKVPQEEERIEVTIE